MTFSTYHLYADAITQRDQAVLTIAIIVLVAFEILIILRKYRPGWLPFVSWLFIGGFYATLLGMALYLRAGA